jgi:hypothetical protein
MIHNTQTLKITLCFIVILFLSILFNCKKRSGYGLLDPEVEVGKGFLTVLPVDKNIIDLFVNLGHLSPPAHTFPSDHGGFYFKKSEDSVSVLSPGDMNITEMSFVEHITAGKYDYEMTLSVNNGGFSVVFAHITSIHPDILAQSPQFEDGRCFTYIAGTEEYRRCAIDVRIAVSAGDTIGTAGCFLGQCGMDLGIYDLNNEKDFASDQVSNFRYPFAVSPLDYFTEEIENFLIPLCGDYICGFRMIRNVSPVGGIHCYDVPGTAQGLWFKKGEPDFPEDPHMALVYDNVEPQVPVFSVGIGIPNFNTGLYTFTPADSGIVNRLFKDVIPDGKLYRFEIRDRCQNAPKVDAVILFQMIDEKELIIEKQDLLDGPPWIFSENAVYYVR